ncbi:hypothetical protein AVEN_101445-1 [Araneus ventricosus]|uniref:Uncharacterized protein n=1 Tax=Araneus ventricosus TaxID=182803 RepID=A0A4Y2CV60_ARAVE|nr:hypothetical protein AVEN_101445-1 [Araneus ventricosus]
MDISISNRSQIPRTARTTFLENYTPSGGLLIPTDLTSLVWCTTPTPPRPTQTCARPGNRTERKRITPPRRAHGRTSRHTISRAHWPTHTADPQRNRGFIETN